MNEKLFSRAGHFKIILFVWISVEKKTNSTYIFINIIQVSMITGFPIFFIIVNEKKYIFLVITPNYFQLYTLDN